MTEFCNSKRRLPFAAPKKRMNLSGSCHTGCSQFRGVVESPPNDLSAPLSEMVMSFHAFKLTLFKFCPTSTFILTPVLLPAATLPPKKTKDGFTINRSRSAAVPRIPLNACRRSHLEFSDFFQPRRSLPSRPLTPCSSWLPLAPLPALLKATCPAEGNKYERILPGKICWPQSDIASPAHTRASSLLPMGWPFLGCP